MAKYLITGGAGFIGTHLNAHLASQGHQLVILDDLSSGSAVNGKRYGELIVGDVVDADTVVDAAKGVDAIFHLAAIASVPRCNSEWVRAHAVNAGGTVAVLDAAHRVSEGKPIPVVYASSAAVYGTNAELPLKENAVAAPLGPYGVDKYAGELHAAAAGRIRDVPTCGLRFFNVFGPGQDPTSPYSGVITLFSRAILEGRPISVFGDGLQSRDFVYVSDVVRHLVAAVDAASTDGPVFNVCRGQAVNLLDLIESLVVATSTRVPIHFAAPRSGDIRASLGNPEAAIAKLGVTADVSLTEGLIRLFEGHKTIHRAAA
jgi:UDP-glucose 4-epimerase